MNHVSVVLRSDCTSACISIYCFIFFVFLRVGVCLRFLLTGFLLSGNCDFMLALEGSVSFPSDCANTSRRLCLWFSTFEIKVNWLIDQQCSIGYKGWQGDAEGGKKWFVLVQPGCCHTTQNISANLERKNFVLSSGRGVTLGIRRGNFALSSGSADNYRFPVWRVWILLFGESNRTINPFVFLPIAFL